MTFKVIALSTILIIIATFVLSTSHSLYCGKLNNINLTGIFFNVASAFGTSFLFAGGIIKLNVASKIMLIIIMFVGQFGISSTLLVWKR
ncbi:TrkH family potassium uptake protein, partial [Mycoplasmopsis synoviae]